jgi:CRP-like cAMP-binding protein
MAASDAASFDDAPHPVPAARSALADADVDLQVALRASLLAPLFRGRFCDVLLSQRAVRVYEKDDVLYEMGSFERVFYFVQSGVVKVGRITEGGREIIYDVRKDRDVVGELCAVEPVRRDRAVALERSDVVAVPFEQVMDALATHPALPRDFVRALCDALADAHDQVERLAADDVMPRLVGVLRKLAGKLGRPVGERIEIGTYLTQEEVSQMVLARRERVSTALNALRRRGIAHYSPRGRLVLDMRALDAYAACPD